MVSQLPRIIPVQVLAAPPSGIKTIALGRYAYRNVILLDEPEHQVEVT